MAAKRRASRQNLLVLWLKDSALDSGVVAWSAWNGDGAAETMAGDRDDPPYASGLAALRDGWRLIQASQLLPHAPGAEFRTDYLKYEFWFERIVEAAG